MSGKTPFHKAKGQSSITGLGVYQAKWWLDIMGSQFQHRVKSVVYKIHQVQETESYSCKIWRLNSDIR